MVFAGNFHTTTRVHNRSFYFIGWRMRVFSRSFLWEYHSFDHIHFVGGLPELSKWLGFRNQWWSITSLASRVHGGTRPDLKARKPTRSTDACRTSSHSKAILFPSLVPPNKEAKKEQRGNQIWKIYIHLEREQKCVDKTIKHGYERMTFIDLLKFSCPVSPVCIRAFGNLLGDSSISPINMGLCWDASCFAWWDFSFFLSFEKINISNKIVVFCLKKTNRMELDTQVWKSCWTSITLH